jgi:hypothetical protein
MEYAVAPLTAAQLRVTCPFPAVATTLGGAALVQVPVGVADATIEFPDSQVAMVLVDETM